MFDGSGPSCTVKALAKRSSQLGGPFGQGFRVRIHLEHFRGARGSSKQLDEARVAVGFFVLLFERSFVQLLQAEGAHEMLGVELTVHGRDTAPRDGLLAAVTQRAPLGVVMHLTVRPAVVLEEAAARKRLVALLQRQHVTSCMGRHLARGW